LAGVRGFSDPNVQVNNGKPVWQQNVNSELTTNANYLLPWYLNYLGGSFLDATQCMVAGDNGWQDNHAALNEGLNNQWATNNTPWSWGHYQRSDIPVQYSIADGWVIGDMYQVSHNDASKYMLKFNITFLGQPCSVAYTSIGISYCINESQSRDVDFRINKCPRIAANQRRRRLSIH
jgi:phospholipase C